jgi:hypothetical protein
MPTVPDPDAPQTDPPVQPGPPAHRRLFTVAEANRLLPALRAALTAARAHLSEMQAAYREMQALEAVGTRPDGELILAADHRAAAARLAEHEAECQRLLQRIAETGCLVKDLAIGLCDFPAEIDGRPVLLCWRLDEPAVAFYHGYRDGYRGRRPIPPGTP